MTIVSNIHCGETLARYSTEQATFTETGHDAGSLLVHHAHVAPHIAVLVEGAYFERINGEVFLRLPGDEVFYPAYSVHENRFGHKPARCLNIEKHDWSEPIPEPSEPEICDKIKRLAGCEGYRSLAPIARALNLHPVYLARVFRAKTGISVGAYLRNVRIKRASQLILRSDATLGEIAVETGYYDQSHLNKEFGEHAGFTPGELRRLADD